LVLHYEEFVKAFRGGVSVYRLLVATSLPHWADVDTNSTTVRKYHEAVGDRRLWSPLSLLGFATSRVMQEVLKRQDKSDAKALTDFFYANVALSVDDMHYGPFDSSKCVTARSLALDGCAMNYGATRISVWSMARVLDPSVPVVKPPSSKPLVYREPLYLGMRLASFLGALFGFFLFIALCGGLVFMQFFRRDARDNRNAPKVPTAPVTLVFTDIESSTAQWAANPQLMPEAVATHHRLIRALIAQHRCYEVKTIGDSFMIACRSASAAVELVRGLQRKFLEHNWGTTAIDESYRAFEEQRGEEDVDYVPPTARLEPEVYRRLWNGLRVRAGVHTGLCDIRHDEVTKGYDYYGGTSNMAARTESIAHGGQVLLTRAAYMALTASEREKLDVTPLGAVPLRGVPKPVEMFQLNVVPGRTFRPLRLEAEIQEDCTPDQTSSSHSDSVVSFSELTRGARMIATSMFSLLSTFPATERRKVLLSCCERWRVCVPKKGIQNWDDDVYRDVINRVALVVGKVLASKTLMDEDGSSANCSELNSLPATVRTDKVSMGSSPTNRRGDKQLIGSGRRSVGSCGSAQQTSAGSPVSSPTAASALAPLSPTGISVGMKEMPTMTLP
ncbi:receptor-type adenylate cyclase, putative, (fragment), partial [Trypanosoma vivax Y486]